MNNSPWSWGILSFCILLIFICWSSEYHRSGWRCGYINIEWLRFTMDNGAVLWYHSFISVLRGMPLKFTITSFYESQQFGEIWTILQELNRVIATNWHTHTFEGTDRNSWEHSLIWWRLIVMYFTQSCRLKLLLFRIDSEKYYKLSRTSLEF